MKRSVFCALLFCWLMRLPSAGAKELKLEATFAGGTVKGSLKAAVENVKLDPKTDFALLDKPGESKIVATQKLDRVPSRVFLSFEGRVPKGSGAFAVYTIRVNEETVVEPIRLNIDTYTSLGHDIAKACRKGENRIEIISAKESGAPIHVRRVTLTVGEGIGTNDWIIFGLLGVAILLACRWIWFELFWKVMGANPVAATRVSIILTALLLFLAYLYSFASVAPTVTSIVVGSAILFVAIMLMLR